MITLSGLQLVAACPGSAHVPRLMRTNAAALLGTAIHEALAWLAEGHIPSRGKWLEIADKHGLSEDDRGRLAFLAAHLRLPVPSGALAEVGLGYWPDGSVRRVVGGQGSYRDEGQWLSGTIDCMWAEPGGFWSYDDCNDPEMCPPDDTIWCVDFKSGDDENVTPIRANWQLRAGALLAARWTGARRVIPALCFINARECAEAVRAGVPYEGRWECGEPLDAAALDAIEVELRAVLARARGEVDDSHSGHVLVLPQGETDGANGVGGESGYLRGMHRGGGTDASTRGLILGPHCEHCPGRAACPALAREALTLLRAYEESHGQDPNRGKRRRGILGGQGAVRGGNDQHAWPLSEGDGSGARADANGVALSGETIRPVVRGDGDGGRLTRDAAAHLASIIPAIRSVLDAADKAVRAHVQAHGPLVLADGREYGPAIEPVTRYKTGPTFEALAAMVGEERANDAFRTSAEAMKEALADAGCMRGAWRDLQKDIEARGGAVPGAREVWRKRWPAKPAEVVSDGDDVERERGEGADDQGQVPAEEARGSVGPGIGEVRGGAEPGPQGSGGLGQGVGQVPVTRGACAVCARVYTVRSGAIRKHQQPGGGLYCAGSGQPPANGG